MAAAIAWLITSSEVGEHVLALGYRLIGYDISFIPGPSDQKRMFNFRAVLHPGAKSRSLGYCGHAAVAGMATTHRIDPGRRSQRRRLRSDIEFPPATRCHD